MSCDYCSRKPIYQEKNLFLCSMHGSDKMNRIYLCDICRLSHDIYSCECGLVLCGSCKGCDHDYYSVIRRRKCRKCCGLLGLLCKICSKEVCEVCHVCCFEYTSNNIQPYSSDNSGEESS